MGNRRDRDEDTARVTETNRSGTLRGTLQANTIFGFAGNDRVFGGDGDDEVSGDAFDLTDTAQGGNDLLYGEASNDVLAGEAEGSRFDAGLADRARGGNDRLHGEALVQRDATVGGNDVLTGGPSVDQLSGDAGEITTTTAVTRGADRFVFANGSGRDSILDFGNNKDLFDLRACQGIDDFAEVRAETTASAGDSVIDLGAAAGGAAGANVLTLNGFAVTRLDAADFLFA